MLRLATTSDARSIRRLMQAVPGFWQDWWSEHTITHAIQAANGLAFVWDDPAGEIAGFACAHDLGFRAYLSELVVDPERQRKGIGTQLIRAIETALRDRHQRVLIADVWRDAEAFYRTLGWESPEATLLRKRVDPPR